MKTILTLSIILWCSFSFAATFEVGSTRTYKSPNELYLANVLEDFDTIEIDAETYAGTAALAVWEANGLKIVSVGGQAVMNADGESILGKGIWVLTGNFIEVDGFEFFGANVVDMNGAGIRLDGLGMKVKNCFFHDNENGILTTNTFGGEIEISYSEFENNGFGDGFSHNVYIGTCDKLTFEFNYSHGAIVGHNLKTRAAENHINYNRIIDGDNGNSSRLIDISNGGLAFLTGNTLVQGENSPNRNLLGFELEGSSNVNPNQLFLTNNTFVNNRSAGALFVDYGNNTSFVQMFNNIFTGEGDVFELEPESIYAQSNIIEEDISLFDFVDVANYDFQINANSIAIDQGDSFILTLLGVYLEPQYIYVHKTSSAPRICVFCDDLDVGAFEYEGPTSTVDISENEELITYPNPVYEVLNLPEYKTNITNVQMFDAQGKLVSGLNFNDGKVNVSHLPAGVYTLVFKTDGGELVTNTIMKP